MAGGQNGKWPIPSVPKPSKQPNKAGTAGKGGAYGNKRSVAGSTNLGKAGELKAKQ